MENTSLKDLFYAGIGLFSVAAEQAEKLTEQYKTTFEKTISDLVSKGKLTDTEGRKQVEDFFKNTDHKKEEFESTWKKTTDSLVSKLNYVRPRDIEAVLARIEAIEAKLGISVAPVAEEVVVAEDTTNTKKGSKKTTEEVKVEEVVA